MFKDGWQEKRSVKKATIYSALGALRAAVHLAHPRDPSRAVTYAQHALQGALEKDETAELGMAHLPTPVITRWETHPKTTLEDVLRVFDAAILSQGKMNQEQRKTKGRK